MPSAVVNTEQIIEHLGQALCVADRAGEILLSNAALRAYPDRVRKSLERAIAEYASSTHTGGENATAPSRHPLSVDGEYHFEVLISLIPAADRDESAFVAILWDATANHRLLERIDAIDAAGRALVNLDSDASTRLDVGERLTLLEDRIIRYCHDLLNFDYFAVRVLDPKSKRLETVLARGFSEEAKSLTIYAAAEGSGISGFVAATGQSYICADVTRDPLYLPGIDAARSSLTVPLRLQNETVGVLNVESDQVAAFTDEDRQFAEIFARYIAAALHVLKLIAVERHITGGQVVSDVSSELSTPLNEIVSEATVLIDKYAVNDAVRARLTHIISAVDQAKRVLHNATKMPGITGLVPETHTTDPVIGGKRILIADDEATIRETIAEVLFKSGAITVIADDGDTAIAMIRTQHFDLVLSDIKMPNRNGYEVFSTVKDTNPSCPVLLITGFGYDPEHSIVRASKEGLAGVLFKPFRVEQLLEAVRTALTAASAT